MKTYFSLKDFSFSFDQYNPKLFDQISFEIPSPGLVFIVGKNGIGKSTFLKCLQGMVVAPEQSSGILCVNNQSFDLAVHADRLNLLNKSRALCQSFDAMLAPQFTGYENLEFAQFNHNPDLSFVHFNNQLKKELECFSIPLDKQVSLLSGGQRQILALLMVAQKPISLLLLDEPTAALDGKNSDYVMQNVRKLAKEKSICVICISHDADLIKQHADFVITITENMHGNKIFEVTKGFNL